MFSLSKVLWSTVYRCTNQDIEFSLAQNTNQSATVKNKTHARVIKTYWYSYSSPQKKILRVNMLEFYLQVLFLTSLVRRTSMETRLLGRKS